MPNKTAKYRLVRPVTLVGLMGCGKTTVGARVANILGAPFRDADAEIVKSASMEIPEIFEKLGEAAFRDGERMVIARLMGEGPMVLATGGGAFMADETREAINAAGVAVWLNADLDTLVERTSRKATRPLLQNGNPRQILSDLMAVRYPIYAEAAVHVQSTSEGSADDVAHTIVDALAKHDQNVPAEFKVLEALS
ncbi:MAG: shikimate kinase [Pikeienuella sp.]